MKTYQTLRNTCTSEDEEAGLRSWEYNLLTALGHDVTPPDVYKEQTPANRSTFNLLFRFHGRPNWSALRHRQWPTKAVRENAYKGLADLPEHLQAISPLLALQMLNASMGSFVDAQGVSALRLTGFGRAQDTYLKAFNRPYYRPLPYADTPIAERRKGSNVIKALLERPGTEPFAKMVAMEPVRFDGVAPYLDFAVEKANATELPAPYEYDEPVTAEEVRNAVTYEPWDGSTLIDTPRLVLAQRLVICRAWRENRHGTMTAAQLLALSQNVGITPASFLSYAVDDLLRRKVTFITAEEAHHLADQLTEGFNPSPAYRIWSIQIQRAAEALAEAELSVWEDRCKVLGFIRAEDSRPNVEKSLMPEFGWVTGKLAAELSLTDP